MIPIRSNTFYQKRFQRSWSRTGFVSVFPFPRIGKPAPSSKQSTSGFLSAQDVDATTPDLTIADVGSSSHQLPAYRNPTECREYLGAWSNGNDDSFRRASSQKRSPTGSILPIWGHTEYQHLESSVEKPTPSITGNQPQRHMLLLFLKSSACAGVAGS